MTDKETKAYSAIPQPPDGASFRFSRVTTLFDPHPYCIGSRHVVHASDHHHGMLDEYAIESAEKAGAKCCTKGCRLPYSEHRSQLAAVIVVPNNKRTDDLNNLPGLVPYLCSVKADAEAAGVEGFLFPTEAQEKEHNA